MRTGIALVLFNSFLRANGLGVCGFGVQIPPSQTQTYDYVLSITNSYTHSHTHSARAHNKIRKQKRNLKGYYTFIGYDSIETLHQYFHSKSYRKDTVLFRSERGLPVSHVCIHAYFKEHVIRTGLVKRYTPRCLDCGSETVKQRRVIRKQVKLRYSCVTCGGSRD
jgi:hypothetical protein